MHITADAVLLPADHKRDLAVGFQAYQTIDDMAACFLQHFCPDDIVLLIETGFQLHENRNLLAVLCCLSQSCDDRRIAADTVKGLLDGIRAGRNLPDKEFRYLRTVIVTAAVYWGFNSTLLLSMTSPLNLPAPGRCQAVYWIFRFGTALCFC